MQRVLSRLFRSLGKRRICYAACFTGDRISARHAFTLR